MHIDIDLGTALGWCIVALVIVFVVWVLFITVALFIDRD